MSLNPTWQEISLRLLAALLASAIIGYDRAARGHIAGIRTVMLVCLAAAAAMIESNFLLSTTGKVPTSFVQTDALRLPLGILSGIGFIGAGVIVRQGPIVSGVTTAATLWLITVIGLIFGAGFFAFGAAVSLIAFVVLALLRGIEHRVKRWQSATLYVRGQAGAISEHALHALFRAEGMEVSLLSFRQEGAHRALRCHVKWKSTDEGRTPPKAVGILAANPAVTALEWEPLAEEHIRE
jgi:putative Mg2+ transporter-C (MgtC) family protein